MFKRLSDSKMDRRNHSTCKIVKADDGTCFEHHLLPSLGDKFAQLQEREHEKPQVFLRVDCCGQIDRSKILTFAAALEYFGVPATFYLLPPGSYVPLTVRNLESGSNYFGSWKGSDLNVDPQLPNLVACLSELGHDIGLHNDVISHSLRLARPASELLDMQLSGLRESGVPIRSSAAHGSPLCRILVYNNREIFSGVRRPGRVPNRELEYDGFRLQLGQLDQTAFGLEFEAYELPRPQRLSDAGGKWAGRIQGKRLREVYPDSSLSAKDVAQEVFQSMNGAKPRDLHLLLHPKYWSVA